MEFQDIIEILNGVIAKVNNYESGNLIGVMEIRKSYEELQKKLSEFESLKNVGKFAGLLAGLSEKLMDEETEGAVLEIFKSSNENLVDLFSRKKSGQSAAVEINRLINKVHEIINIDIEKEKADGEIYPDTYFSNIINDTKMLSQFCDEAEEHIDTAQYTLIELEYDDKNQDNINKVFRSFHTIKGSSAFLGLKNIEDVGHEMENLLVLVRDGKLQITRELIDVIFYGIELLRSLISVIRTNAYEATKITVSFRTINIYNYINLIKKILAQYPVKKIGEILQEDGKIKEIDIDRILEKQTSIEKKFGEIALEEMMITRDDLSEAIKKQQTPVRKKSSYVKVSNDRLNSLIDIVGELVINQSMLRQVIKNNEEAVDNSERIIIQLETITTGIKNLVLSMGMVPIAEIFNKIRVVIRNTAQELKKTIVFETRGDDTELDRNVIESIYDPLVHMVRNAIDHGIESPEERESLKKDRVGKIIVSAEHKGNGIEISVFDDGKGIDKENILTKAKSMGLVDDEKAVLLTDKEIYGFMFIPGFTTAQKVTELSGRGVGLDVVKKNIEEIHGRIEILTQKGEFTRFVIKLPLTLAIIEGFVTVIGRNKYVFPFNLIDEIVVPDNGNIMIMEDMSRMLYSRDLYIPIIEAGNVFKEEVINTDLDKALLIVINFENKKYCLAVNKVLGKQEIVIKSLGEALTSLSIFSGGTIFGDGTIGFVVDIEGFLEAVRRMQ